MLTMQTIKKNWVYIFFVFALIVFAIRKLSVKKEENTGGKEFVTVKTIHTNSGWGYEIYKGDSIFIRQETIPAIQGNKAFVNEEQAKNIGKLAASKLSKQQFPTISVQELDSCGITR